MPHLACSPCRRSIAAPDQTEGIVVYCPECGDCLQAPAAWAGHQADDDETPASAQADHTGLGAVFLLFGVFLVALLFMDMSVETRLQFAFVCLFFIAGGLYLLGGTISRRLPGLAGGILSIPEGLPAEANQLGSLKAVFASGRAGSLENICMGIALCGGSAVILYKLATGQPLGMKVTMVAAFAGPAIGGWLLWRGLQSLGPRQSVLLFEHGLLRWGSDRFDVCRWDEIQQLLHNPPAGQYTIVCHGEKNVLDQGFANLMQLADRIDREHSAYVMPALLTRLAAGESIPFGALGLNRSGLTRQDYAIGWNEVKQATFSSSEGFTVYTVGGTTWCNIPLTRLPNFQLFRDAVERYIEVAQ